jgi:hypothetical protein
MIKAISAGDANPSFRDCILPRRLYARPFGLQSLLTERRISVEDGVTIRTRFGECFAQFLDDHSAVGWSVTLRRRIRSRRSITKKRDGSNHERQALAFAPLRPFGGRADRITINESVGVSVCRYAARCMAVVVLPTRPFQAVTQMMSCERPGHRTWVCVVSIRGHDHLARHQGRAAD